MVFAAAHCPQNGALMFGPACPALATMASFLQGLSPATAAATLQDLGPRAAAPILQVSSQTDSLEDVGARERVLTSRPSRPAGHGARENPAGPLRLRAQADPGVQAALLSQAVQLATGSRDGY